MSNLKGSFWTRKKDGIPFEVVTDFLPGTGGNRSIKVRNCRTGREHWATPEGLERKYRRDYMPPEAS
ncbi:hypothetical protein SEA_SPOOKY_56 [Gordonia phage Spooky]|nr:hypothetical protein SEA_SPOOKY_56 [Gordonia phage Spooky]